MLHAGGAFSSLVVGHGKATSDHSTEKLKFMAQVLGESGRYASQEAVRKRRAMLGWIMLLMVFVGLIVGFLLRGLLPGLTISSWAGIFASIVALVLMCRVGNWTLRRAEELDRERTNFARGADGENSVAAILERFPDDFRVINDLTAPYGNLDHVVGGPAGVFCLDTEDWRGGDVR
jgi:MFS family permease